MKSLPKVIFALCFLITLAHTIEVSAETLQHRVIITFKEEINDRLIEQANGEINREFNSVPVAAVTINDSGLRELENSSLVEKIEKDVLVRTNVQVSDWGIQSVLASLAWQTGYTGKGVKVAVIDSGISPHEDLIVAGGKSLVDYTPSFIDDNGHGTHVAGIIGGRDNGFGIIGIAPEAEIYALKAFNQSGTTYLSNIIAGIDWAISNDMDIINMSLGAQVDSDAFHNVVDEAYRQGILLVSAAGNDGTGSGDTVDYPARYSSVIGVGAIDQQSGHASFSSTGPSVEVVAPGVSIFSTFNNGRYGRMDGTSMATPYVAGYLALLKEAYPTLSNVQLRQILINNTRDLGAPGLDTYFGHGLVQASAFTQPLFSVPASANPAVTLTLNTPSIKEFPNETLQLSVVVKLKDGTMLDVTNEAKWVSSNESIATVFAGNVVTITSGRSIITAFYGGLATSVEVEVMNPNPVPEVDVDFEDVNSGFWAYEEISRLREKQIISGYQDNTFRPNSHIRRDHVAVIFSKSIELVEKIDSVNFLDVPENYLYYKEIRNTQLAGIFSGNAGIFEPQENLTRAQMAKILVTAFELERIGEHPFSDVSKNHWANDFIHVLYSNGITTGSNGQYNPEEFVTRAEFAVFLSRAFTLK